MRRQIHDLHDGGSTPPLQTSTAISHRFSANGAQRRSDGSGPKADGLPQATSWAQLGLQNPTCGVRSLGCLLCRTSS